LGRLCQGVALYPAETGSKQQDGEQQEAL